MARRRTARQVTCAARRVAIAIAMTLGCGFGAASAEPDNRPLPPHAPTALTDAGHERLRTLLSDAWADATDTWTSLLGPRLYQSDSPRITFVPAVRASHCYGLYISAGPVYCSGNTTVFVSVASMEDLARQVPAMGDAGLTFLVAHELGHHVQKLTGRFRVFSELVRSAPQRQREIALRFELEADCLAGVWASNSPKFAASGEARAMLSAALAEIGDDRILSARGAKPDPATYTHGTSEQRVRWFRIGLSGGRTEVCNAMQTADF